MKLVLSPAKSLDFESKLPTPPVKRPALEDEFPPNFILAVNMICDTYDKRTLAAKLKSIGVSTNAWKAFLKNEKNRKYFEKRFNDSFHYDTGVAAKIALSNNVAAGDLQSIKYYNEWTGKYIPGQQNDVSIGIIIAKLMEILARRLAPQALNEIANEIELALSETKELPVATPSSY